MSKRAAKIIGPQKPVTPPPADGDRRRHRPYLTVVEPLFGSDGIDFTILRKIYGGDPEREAQCQPRRLHRIEKRVICREPDDALISTSYVEHQSSHDEDGAPSVDEAHERLLKKVENLAHAVSLHFMHYDFCRGRTVGRIKQPPRWPPGVADDPWTVYELVGLVDQVPSKRPTTPT